MRVECNVGIKREIDLIEVDGILKCKNECACLDGQGCYNVVIPARMIKDQIYQKILHGIYKQPSNEEKQIHGTALEILEKEGKIRNAIESGVIRNGKGNKVYGINIKVIKVL